jgi:exo-1,4-beta-D-glucosaminidase
LGISPAVGMTERQSAGGVFGQSASGIEQEDASTAFSLSAIEIYSYGN